MHLNVCKENTRPCNRQTHLAATVFTKKGSVLKSCEPVGQAKGFTLARMGAGVDGVSLRYSGTEPCLTGDGTLQTVSTSVHFMCSEEAGPGKPESVHRPNECEFIVLWPSKYGCGSKAGGKAGAGVGGAVAEEMAEAARAVESGGGWTFVFLVVFCFGCYCGVGFYHRSTTTGVSGWEAVPNVEFWNELPGLVQDGCRYSYQVLANPGGDLEYAPLAR